MLCNVFSTCWWRVFFFRAALCSCLRWCLLRFGSTAGKVSSWSWVTEWHRVPAECEADTNDLGGRWCNLLSSCFYHNSFTLNSYETLSVLVLVRFTSRTTCCALIQIRIYCYNLQYYPHIPIGMLGIYHLLFVSVFLFVLRIFGNGYLRREKNFAGW